jgi:hypothetical protein
MDDWEDSNSGLSESDYNNQKYFIDELSPDIIPSLIEYTGDMYTAVNNYLEDKLDNRVDRNDEYIRNNDFIKLVVKNIDSAFNQVPALENDLVVYRGLNLPIYTDSRRNTLMLPQYSGKYDGFVSTSPDINVALRFVNRVGKKIPKTLLKITVPKGSKVIYLGFQSINPTENEILINRNAIISVYSIEKLVEDTNIIQLNARLNPKLN